ncbi:carboxymuconolactone decarboxylase family protein [Nonomuraea recticatena]|uniref:carboxymuconolactone decarboxylase family protein n=1 Tax=Nonomuraea recticatena TaxID=46178 RepID=UPI003610EC38
MGAAEESLLAGPSRRTDKEVIALGVSVANRCPFCVDAHTVFLHAMGEHALGEAIARGERPAGPRHALLLDWARRERAADLPVDQVGTALACHFVNRMVSALVGENLLPGGMDSSPSSGGRRAGRCRAPCGGAACQACRSL